MRPGQAGAATRRRCKRRRRICQSHWNGLVAVPRHGTPSHALSRPGHAIAFGMCPALCKVTRMFCQSHRVCRRQQLPSEIRSPLPVAVAFGYTPSPRADRETVAWQPGKLEYWKPKTGTWQGINKHNWISNGQQSCDIHRAAIGWLSGTVQLMPLRALPPISHCSPSPSPSQ